jgi:hypothetical protein
MGRLTNDWEYVDALGSSPIICLLLKTFWQAKQQLEISSKEVRGKIED